MRKWTCHSRVFYEGNLHLCKEMSKEVDEHCIKRKQVCSVVKLKRKPFNWAIIILCALSNIYQTIQNDIYIRSIHKKLSLLWGKYIH